MESTTDLALHDVFYAERRLDGSELLACGGKGQEIACQFMPTIAGVAERLEPCRLGAAVRMLRIEQVVANLFGCGGRLGCIWDWHRDGKRQNDGDQWLATMGCPCPQTLSQVHCVAWFHAGYFIGPSEGRYRRRWLPSVALGFCRLARSTAVCRRSQVATHSRRNRGLIQCASH